MINSLQKSHLVDEAVSFFTNERVSKMKTESTDDWHIKVWDTLIINEKPPKEEFEAKLQELINAQPLKEFRQERNKRLTECDWVTLKAYSTDTPVPEEWKVYMQALRDLPSVTEDPANPVWPTRPDEVVNTETVTETSNTETVTETSNTETVTETSNTETVTETSN